jgi:hypothetical protein
MLARSDPEIGEMVASNRGDGAAAVEPVATAVAASTATVRKRRSTCPE